MTNAPSADTTDKSLPREILDAARDYLGGRRILLVIVAVLIVGWIAFNWGWLIVFGWGPILLLLLPCAVMCALDLCMHKITGGDKSGRRSGVAGGTQAPMAVNSQYPVADASDLIDPVSQRMLPAATAIATVYQGRIYYFEERPNRDAFEIEPDKYLAGSQAIGRKVGSSGKPGEHSHHGHGCCG